jgi:patched 1 protein/patched 2 protein
MGEFYLFNSASRRVGTQLGSEFPICFCVAGIDDVFVLVTILRNYLEDPQLKGRNGSRVPDVEMRLTVALAGPSVVLTTFSVLASFLISSVVSK